jgi:adenosylcobinamide-phosphate synthase
VSRDTAALDATQVREAAIETLAENLNDSVIAPLFWFAIAGLPGAAVYRFANTADAMWGYRDHREWAGKFAARADDLLSWLPARLSALALLAARPALLPRLAGEARRTPSPNSGWPMAAMALRLDLKLGKPGVYQLNSSGAQPGPGDVALACRCAAQAMLPGIACTALLAWGLRV